MAAGQTPIICRQPRSSIQTTSASRCAGPPCDGAAPRTASCSVWCTCSRPLDQIGVVPRRQVSAMSRNNPVASSGGSASPRLSRVIVGWGVLNG